MAKTTLMLNDKLIRLARKLTGLKTKQEIVDTALKLLVQTGTRKGMVSHFGSGIWRGDLRRTRRNRR